MTLLLILGSTLILARYFLPIFRREKAPVFLRNFIQRRNLVHRSFLPVRNRLKVFILTKMISSGTLQIPRTIRSWHKAQILIWHFQCGVSFWSGTMFNARDLLLEKL